MTSFLSFFIGSGADDSRRHIETEPSEDPNVRVLVDKSLYEFYGPKKGTSAEVEIVLLHGLEPGKSGNAYYDTWKSHDGATLWPRWLGSVFNSARVLSVSYDSSMIQGRTMGRLDLYCVAENLIQDLMTDREEGRGAASQANYPVVMVGKDLGCLVIKAVCMKAKERGMTAFLNNLKGFLFYCPISQGVTKLPGRYDGNLAKNLAWGEKDVARLNQDFSTLRDEQKWVVKGVAAGALAPIGVPIREVPEASGRVDVDEYYTAPGSIDTVCRFRGKQDIENGAQSLLANDGEACFADILRHESCQRRGVGQDLPRMAFALSNSFPKFAYLPSMAIHALNTARSLSWMRMTWDCHWLFRVL